MKICDENGLKSFLFKSILCINIKCSLTYKIKLVRVGVYNPAQMVQLI